ncbi:CDP-glycerol glycerophosphotransferase family protein [Brachybacterium aquaticum]|uniref:CDP-ribitol ribitolphosphotransferase n=1 Tax=Brachybacterium aquaticum TaxID=1432564 RepID=A0A841A8W3_9MICO|nr:CDP-glycerol glycerophosphotransferase family protein [Brachybacterium aquaticum]MBB5830377.1 CDP-ribitol ribitolphosphotransferase [Brachybacterium aquaticum]
MTARLKVADIAWDHIWMTLRLTFEGTDDPAVPDAGGLSEAEDPVPLPESAPGDSAGDYPDVPGELVGAALAAEADDPAAAAIAEGEGPAGDGVGQLSTEAGTEGRVELPAEQELAAQTPSVPSLPDIESGAVEFLFVDKKNVQVAEATHLGGREYEIRINITRFNGRRQFPDGTWRLIPRVDGGRGKAATYDLSGAERLPELSRVFLYDSNRTGYTISFGFSEAEDPPVLLMRVYQLFKRSKAPKKQGPMKRLRTYPSRLRKRATSRKNKNKALTKYYTYVREHRPANRKPRILFASEQRPRISGNLLRIRDRMIERGLDKDFEFSESFRVPSTSDKRTTLRAVKLLAEADFVFIDDYFAMFDSLKLAEDCTIVQVWHAGSGFKAVGYSRFGNYGSPKLNNAHRRYTYAITGSKHLVPVYAEVFGIEEEAVIPTGLPRIDSFLDPQRTEEVQESFYRENPDLKDKRLILFAPTFRGRGIRDGYYDYDRIDFEALHDSCGDDTVVLFRMHHFVNKPIPIPPEYSDRLRDFSHFPDGNDLLHSVDLLITDYSSIIYEYSLLERPMLFFAYDKDVYSTTRGFHRDYVETAPGKVCTTFDELLTAMKDGDHEEWRREKFVRENFDHVDTHSADRVIDWLILGEPIGSPVAGQDQIDVPSLEAPHETSADRTDEHQAVKENVS